MTQPARRTDAPLWLALLLCLAATGCVRVYQPMSGLNRPVVVDPQAANFRDVRLSVYCVPGDVVNARQAGVLCQNVGALFENQGAAVTTYTRGRLELAGDDDELAGTPDAEGSAPTDLALELRSRLVHEAVDPLSWVFCLMTSTLLPAVSESTFAIDTEVRDGTGFLLARETLQGRLVERFGIGTWAVNRVADLTWRSDDEKLTQDAANHDLSDDLYRQLSQILFNARMQWEVLQAANPGTGP